jgi:hypothetical protein
MQPGKGTLIYNGDGTFTYTPSAAENRCRLGLLRLLR